MQILPPTPTQHTVLRLGVQRAGWHLCVLGLIGAGKTTISRALCAALQERTGQCELLLEPVSDNPLLPLYYQQPELYAFPMQVHMLNCRYAQQLHAQNLALLGQNSVQDSSVFGDSCFVELLAKQGLFSPVLQEVYSQLFLNMSRNFMYPTAVVYIDMEPSVAYARMQTRARSCEATVPLAYLEQLHAELQVLRAGLEQYTLVLKVQNTEEYTMDEQVNRAHAWCEQIAAARATAPVSRIGV